MFFTSKSRNHSDLVSASEVGQHAFCPEAFRLSVLETALSPTAQKRMDQGIRTHENWTKAAYQRSYFALILAMALLLLAFHLLFNRGILSW